MKAPPSKLKVSVTAESEREIDEILATRSDEEFLLDSPPPPPSHPLSGPAQPIPANRIALLREIELENAELARRHWWREVAQRVLLITALIVTMAIMVIFIWLLYLAVTTSTQEKHRHLHVPRVFFDTNEVPKYEEELFSGQTFVMMPKKMNKMRKLQRRKINDALFKEE